MTLDEIISMAREADMDIDDDSSAWGAIITAEPADLKRFAALVAAHEREACAKVCDSLHDKIELVEKTEHYPGEYGSEYDAGQGNAICECADAIRARGEE